MNGSKRILQILILLDGIVATLSGAAKAKAEPVTYILYLSAPGAGTAGPVAYADEDIVRYTSGKAQPWAMHFDGSAAGLPAAADIDAYNYQYNQNIFTGYHLMSFDQPITIPGLGQVDDSDVVLYTKSLGIAGTWSLYFDGSAYGLTTDGEDVDAIEVIQGYLYLSTLGNFSVNNPGGTLSGQNEDVFAWDPAGKDFFRLLDGKEWFGITAADNDLRSMAFDVAGAETWFYTLSKAATIGGATVAPHDILRRDYEDKPKQLLYSRFWDASQSAFPKIDAIDVTFVIN